MRNMTKQAKVKVSKAELPRNARAGKKGKVAPAVLNEAATAAVEGVAKAEGGARAAFVRAADALAEAGIDGAALAASAGEVPAGEAFGPFIAAYLVGYGSVVGFDLASVSLKARKARSDEEHNALNAGNRAARMSALRMRRELDKRAGVEPAVKPEPEATEPAEDAPACATLTEVRAAIVAAVESVQAMEDFPPEFRMAAFIKAAGILLATIPQ